MSRLEVGGRRRTRRRVATVVGLVVVLAAVFVQSVGAQGTGPYEVWRISGKLSCNRTDPTVCQVIPGFPAPQLGQATFHIDLFQNLTTGEKWGEGNITFHVHTVQRNPGPPSTAIVQKSEYFDSPGRPAWFIAPDPRLLSKPSFFVNGTRCDSGGRLHRNDEVCIPLVNQATHHPAIVGHSDWDALFAPVIPQPDGVSIQIQVTHKIVEP
jgi:hypothetical protein